MKVIREPQVYLVSSSEARYGVSEFLEAEGLTWRPEIDSSDIEDLPEVAGRLCYMSFNNPRPGGNKAYLQHILEAGHGSVLEHSTFGFIFTGISRSLTHELVRHRHFSFSQLSQRYVDESDAGMVCPDAIANDAMNRGHWEGAVRIATQSYVDHVEMLIMDGPEAFPGCKGTEIRKAARGAARSVLPNATETKIMMSGNCRAWRGFLEQRASRHADGEIRKLANKVYAVLVQEAPNIFSDYTKIELPDGTFELATPYRKV